MRVESSEDEASRNDFHSRAREELSSFNKNMWSQFHISRRRRRRRRKRNETFLGRQTHPYNKCLCSSFITNYIISQRHSYFLFHTSCEKRDFPYVLWLYMIITLFLYYRADSLGWGSFFAVEAFASGVDSARRIFCSYLKVYIWLNIYDLSF